MVSRSSTEFEYKALTNASTEPLWVQYLLHDLGVFLPLAPTLYYDNIGATYLSSNPVYHARTKHIEIDYHFVRDRVAKKTLQVRLLSSKDQIADILTKPLPTVHFYLLQNNLTVVPPSRLPGAIEASMQDMSAKNEKLNVNSHQPNEMHPPRQMKIIN